MIYTDNDTQKVMVLLRTFRHECEEKMKAIHNEELEWFKNEKNAEAFLILAETDIGKIFSFLDNTWVLSEYQNVKKYVKQAFDTFNELCRVSVKFNQFMCGACNDANQMIAHIKDIEKIYQTLGASNAFQGMYRSYFYYFQFTKFISVCKKDAFIWV